MAALALDVSFQGISMSRTSTIIALTFFALFSAPTAGLAETANDPAAQQINSFYVSLLETMKRGPQLGMQGRYNALAPAIDRAYDLTTMMQFIVGPGWSTMAAADRNALVTAFRRMTIANYATNFDRFSGERFNVDPNVQERGGDKIVQTQLVPSGDKPVDLIYRMRQSGTVWKIIDVYLAGYVDQAALKRSDFASTLASGGPKALAAKINNLADVAMAGTKAGP